MSGLQQSHVESVRAMVTAIQTWSLRMSFFGFHGTRNTITTVENRAQRDAEEQERLLAEKVAAATADQVKHRLEQDLKVLRDRVKG